MKMKAFVVFELMILVHVSQHASGVEVYEGAESVLLPCHISMTPEDPVVVWSRLDLNPTTVHQLQDKTDEPYVQNQRFSKRTSMSAVALDTGDLSLTLNKPRLHDSGNYTCSIHSGKYQQTLTDVQLQVKEPYTFPAEAWLLLVLLAVVVASVLAVCLYFKVITVSQVEVEEGTESVELPYKTILKPPEYATVMWSRCEPKPMLVHVYEKGQDQSDKQDQFYHDRTVMKENPLKTGELSLTLKKPCIRDSGTYMCTVQTYRHIWAQKVVQLRFKVTQVEVEEWRTFTLPFKTSVQLPEDATVEWIRSKPQTMIVHVYQDGRDQPDKQDEYYYGRTEMNNSPLQSRDLSVKVYKSGFSDRGTYICRVLVNGDVLVQKEVLLHVKVSKVKAETTKLLCQIKGDLPEDATVEWTRCEPKSAVVHVYENGLDRPERQDRFFQNRTDMKIDLLKTGNLSLTLRHPDDRDSGVYMCTVHRGEDILARRVVPFRAEVHQQEVEEGTASVQLPFQSSVLLPEDTTVEWSRCEPKPRVVHVYGKGQDQSERQDQFYRGRTEMKKKPLQSRDLSLILRHPTHKDSDYYVCTISGGGDIVRQKVVRFQVKVTQVEVEEWRTFTLPFKTSVQLPEDATVEWIRSKPKTMTVHVYQDGRDQPDKQDEYFRGRTKMDSNPLQSRDLSVKVYNSGFSDRGTYICRVLVNGDVLVQKEVLLHVKVSKVKAETTKLLCQIKGDLPEDATVEWTRCEPKSAVVHVYENGLDRPERQDGFFQNRTDMKIDLLKTGNLSLTLRHPDDRDSGVYMCTVRRGEDILARRVVPFRAKVHQQEVEEGTASVQLPFQSSVLLPEDTTVEWSRCEPKPRVVHVYGKGQDQSERQDQFYRGRTEMKKKPLQSRDLSLILRHPTHKDSDYYVCTVSGGGDIVRQKVVRLQVKEGGGWSAEEGSQDEDEVDAADKLLQGNLY